MGSETPCAGGQARAPLLSVISPLSGRRSRADPDRPVGWSCCFWEAASGNWDALLLDTMDINHKVVVARMGLEGATLQSGCQDLPCAMLRGHGGNAYPRIVLTQKQPCPLAAMPSCAPS